jgi:adenylate cyclase
MKTLKKIAVGIALSLLVSFGAALLLDNTFGRLLNRLEYVTYDWRYRIKFQDTEEGVEFPHYGIHIVDIDDRSMDKLGSYWGWNRGYQAKMLDSLSTRFPAAIAFDILFYAPEDSIRYERLARTLNDAIACDTVLARHATELNERLAAAVNYDEQLANAIARSGRVTLGIALAEDRDYRDFTSQVEHRMNMEWHNSLNPASAITMPEQARRRIRHEKNVIDGTYPAIAQAARDIGHVNIVDRTTVVRMAPLLYRFGKFEPVYLPMSVRVAATLFGTPNEEIVVKLGEYIDIGTPFKIFKEQDGRVRFSYPDFTEAQLRLIQKQEWRRIDSGTDPKRTWKQPVSSYAALNRDEEGRACLETRGGRFSYGATAALTDFLKRSETAEAMEIDDEIDIGGGFTLRRDTEIEWEIYSDDEQIWLSALDVKTLSSLTRSDLELEEGVSRKLLTFDFWVRRERNGTLVSSLPVLRGKVLQELIWEGVDIDALPPGSRLDLGTPARIPLHRNTRHVITYFGPRSKPFPYFSFYDVMKNNVNYPMEGCVFVVGSTSPALFDIKSAPHERSFPAIEFHASILNSIFTDTYVRRLTQEQDFRTIVLAGFAAALIAFFTKPVLGGILVAGSIFLYAFAAFQVFDRLYIWIEMVRPMITIVFTFAMMMVYRYVTEERDRKFLQQMFKHYLSPELIDMMYTQKQRPQLGGDEGIRTAFFTDIEGFSTFSEKLGSPTRLVELLNEYLSAMTDILLSHYGTLDKYEGDAIIAFFGAPAVLPNHAARACHTAIDMQLKLNELRVKWSGEKCNRKCSAKKCGDKCGQKDKWPEIVHNMRMRIGINTGAITTGNMGSAVRMNYTMMGDAVNLAARLESAAKQYGVSTMISEFTYNEVKEFEVRKLGRVRVVGKNEAVTVYELICRKNELTKETADLLTIYNRGVEHYYKQEWKSALNCFIKADALEPNRKFSPDKPTPSSRFEKSCMQFIDNPPGSDWDGVDELQSK